MPVNRLNDIQGKKAAFITTTVIDWIPILVEKAAIIATKLLADSAAHYQASILGYVIMPSHVHAIIGFQDIRLLSQYMQSYKSLTSRAIKAADIINNKMEKFSDTDACQQREKSFCMHDGFRLWMRRFDDVIIESQKHFLIKLNYIHENPARSGLADKVESWPYSSARTWMNGEEGLIKIDTDFAWLR
jgi:putative transposase